MFVYKNFCIQVFVLHTITSIISSFFRFHRTNILSSVLLHTYICVKISLIMWISKTRNHNNTELRINSFIFIYHLLICEKCMWCNRNEPERIKNISFLNVSEICRVFKRQFIRSVYCITAIWCYRINNRGIKSNAYHPNSNQNVIRSTFF